MRIEHVGYDHLRAHYPALFVSYCLDEPRAAKFFTHRYRDEKAILERARKAAEKGMEKTVLDSLRRYHADCGAPPGSMAALEELGSGAAAVVTGQQPSVGWGPLYNFYKAQAAIRYAQAIASRGVPCVPVFWNHSDDVRGGDSVSFPGRDNEVKEVPLPPGAAGAPLFESGTPEALRMFAAVLAEALPKTEFTPRLEDWLREVHQGTVAESFTRALLSLLGPSGLVVLEPRHLEGERAERFFAAHLADPSRLSRAVEAGRRAVTSEGFEDRLGREVGLDVFEIRGGRRARLERPGAVKGRLSAGVALRPLLQDAVLPTCAYVGGPSEVGYQAEIREAYAAFGIDAPVVFPRSTATLVEPKVAKLIEKFGLKPEDLFAGGREPAAKAPAGDAAVSAALARLPERLMAEVEGLMRGLESSASVAKAKERTAAKVREALAALAGRVEEELRRSEATGEGQRAKLWTHLRPGGKLQERIFTPLYYLSLFGPDFASKLQEALDPFVFSHQLINI